MLTSQTETSGKDRAIYYTIRQISH